MTPAERVLLALEPSDICYEFQRACLPKRWQNSPAGLMTHEPDISKASLGTRARNIRFENSNLKYLALLQRCVGRQAVRNEYFILRPDRV
jgi:hypothetical protein